jgi:putative ABC transport system permease protein
VKALVAWRILAHEKGRSGLAIGGVFVAILLMFLQLGFYASVPRAGLIFYDAMRFDLLLTSSAYVFEGQSSTFPRRRLFQALALPEVLRANALYHDRGRWLNDDEGIAREIFVMGLDLRDVIFDLPEIEHQVDVLRQPDTILVEAASRREFGVLDPGRRIEIEQRNVTIAGTYGLGVGFLGLGVAMTSVKILPADTQVFTRAELNDHEMNHWVTRTSTGLVFGCGLLVAAIVGLVILNQTLSTQITRQLPQFATLKAMGYSDGYLGGMVVTLAIIMSTISYVPAAVISVILYSMVRRATKLPIEMTTARMVAVLAIVWGMSALSAVVALRVLRRADPVELF